MAAPIGLATIPGSIWRRSKNSVRALTVGWRRDDNDDFGEHDSWRVSGRLGLTGFAEAWAIRAATGTGFRAPAS
ncbi:MAG: hypothetical protein CM15mP74_04560 [Halieaceae bacterium]|nr:MAG: hypothetical protein CM15mP74_04560 [Halieaceae bacterium]